MNNFLNLPLWVIEKGLSTWEDYQLDAGFENFWFNYHLQKERGLHVQNVWDKFKIKEYRR